PYIIQPRRGGNAAVPPGLRSLFRGLFLPGLTPRAMHRRPSGAEMQSGSGRIVLSAGENTGVESTDPIHIPPRGVMFTFARSGGPGGQNVNKVASKAVLRWDLAANASLPADVRERLRARQRRRITTEGALVLQGQRFRDQAKNIEDCRARLREMVL